MPEKLNSANFELRAGSIYIYIYIYICIHISNMMGYDGNYIYIQINDLYELFVCTYLHVHVCMSRLYACPRECMYVCKHVFRSRI